MLKGLGNIANMLKHAQGLGDRMQEINAQLQAARVTGQAGGGMVTIEMNGLGEALSVKIDPALADETDVEMIEDLTCAAINQANGKARQLHAETMRSLVEGVNLPIPGLSDAISKLMNPSAILDATDEPPGGPA